jgi:hypothetical protein
MERKLAETGYRESEITHAPGTGEVGKTVRAELARGSDAFQVACKKAATAIGTGFHDGRDEVIAYTRREPVAALTAAAGFGLFIGLVIAMGSRSGARSGSAWLPRLQARRSSLFGRRASSGWRAWGK